MSAAGSVLPAGTPGFSDVPWKDPAFLAMTRDYLAQMVGGALPIQLVQALATQLHVVLDTSVILANLFWTAQKRRLPTALSSIEELLASRTLVAFVPTETEAEVQSNLADIAAQTGTTIAALRTEWERMRKRLHWVRALPVRTPAKRRLRDANDAPFVSLHGRLGFPVLSTDKDLHAAVKAVDPRHFDLTLRNYARGRNEQMTIILSGGALAYLGSAAVVHTVTNLPSIGRFIGNLPLGVKLGAAGVGAFLVFTESGQGVLRQARVLAGELFQYGVDALGQILARAAELHRAANADLVKAGETVRWAKCTLRQAVLAVVASAQRPLTLDDVVKELPRQGLFRSSAKTHGPQVLRALRQLPDVQCTNGRWAMVPFGAPAPRAAGSTVTTPRGSATATRS